jgi:GNAT superfamily N-acetyltransferase
MTAELVPTLVEPKSASRDFWARYHRFRRIRQLETRPNDPIRPDDLEEARFKRDDPFGIDYRYEISRGAEMLSWFHGATFRPGTAEYESNKQFFQADVSVHPDHRRRGIGASWLPLVVELMDRHGCTTLNLATEEKSGYGFLKWLGAEEKLVGAENRLDLTHVDWGMVQRWISEGERRSPQTRMEIYDGPLPEPIWDEFTRQISAMLNTMPWDDLEHGDIVVTSDNMRDDYARHAATNTRLHTVITRELDGVISGVTDMTWEPWRPAIIDQQFTGVLPSARGRGLGKWIKAAMLDHVHELYPEGRWVSTGNANSNGPMLAINKRLGFKAFIVGAEYQIGRDRVAARVRRPARA